MYLESIVSIRQIFKKCLVMLDDIMQYASVVNFTELLRHLSIDKFFLCCVKAVSRKYLRMKVFWYV